MDERNALVELLTLIIDEDCCWVEGGPEKLDKAAFAILERLPNPPPKLAVYCKED